jgi:aerobic-type carbon monoxide dehydrogenase small subunit (CoxS/CutS family)
MRVNLTINGAAEALEVRPGAMLLDLLREHGYMGVKRGCEAGTCGSCVVLIDGEPRYSCLLFAAGLEGRSVTTIEGLGTPTDPHPLMESFVDEAAVQCGYCVPAMILSAKALLDERVDPDEEQVKQALDGHLCRCTGYVKQIKAVLRAAERLREGRRDAEEER